MSAVLSPIPTPLAVAPPVMVMLVILRGEWNDRSAKPLAGGRSLAERALRPESSQPGTSLPMWPALRSLRYWSPMWTLGRPAVVIGAGSASATAAMATDPAPARARRRVRDMRRTLRCGHVPEHQDASQLRAPRDRRGGPRLRAAVRAQDQRHDEAVAGQPGGLRPGRRGGRRRDAPPARRARDAGAAARPRRRGGQGARARRQALRHRSGGLAAYIISIALGSAGST